MSEHPFAPFVRILGKGKSGARSLTRAEAQAAMTMILEGKVRPEQLGAFLMLLRVKEEAPEELAGFVDAARMAAQAPSTLHVDLDWSSYAGKKRQLPWFLLAAFVLAEQGERIFMHGVRGHTAGRLYTEDMLSLFGMHACSTWQAVEHALEHHQFAYMRIDTLVPKLGEIIGLRDIFGLRSPVHTLCRLINPLQAPCTVDGVFHPAYAPMHQQASFLLNMQHSLTIRGDGGEAELKPDSLCEVRWIRDGQLVDETWPRLFDRRLVKDTHLDPALLLAVWRGEASHEYGEGAVMSTLAALLILRRHATNYDEALAMAKFQWENRLRTRY